MMVWVCRDNNFRLPRQRDDLHKPWGPFELFPHRMKRDMVFPHPKDPTIIGPGVLFLAEAMPAETFRCAQLNDIVVHCPTSKETLTFLELLERGYDLLTTGVKKFPIIVVNGLVADVAYERDWLVEDHGDGLQIYQSSHKLGDCDE